jgi:type II restriction enzyme
MATAFQALGALGEQRVIRHCACPKCKRSRTLVRLPPNFKCADIICDFCGYLGQVKASRVRDIEKIPKSILGAAWRPQKERMDAAIYFPLFLVLFAEGSRQFSIFYLAADLQMPQLFKPRTPLSKTARRAGWQGFTYETATIESSFVRLV